MYGKVYSHLLTSFGSKPLVWVGVVTQIIRVLCIRVFSVVVVSKVIATLAAGDIEAAKEFTLLFMALYILGFMIGAAGDIIGTEAENRVYGKLMVIYYKKLMSKDMDFFRNNQTGFLTSIYRQYLDGSMMLMRFLRGEALATFISITVPPIILFMYSRIIGTVSILIVLAQIIYISWSSKKASHYRKITNEIYRKVSGEVSDQITNIIAFKSAANVKKSEMTISDLAKQENEAFSKRRTITTLLDIPRNLVTAIGVSAVVFILIQQNPSGNNIASAAILVLTYMFQIVRIVSSVPEIVMNHDDLVTKIYPTLELLGSTYETIKDPKHPVQLSIHRGEITFENISFSYQNEGKKIRVFKDFNLTVVGGQKVGLVGLSGAGKSTLTNLLLRFDEVDKGAIKIDGIDIRKVRQDDVRKHIAYVPQEPLLFHKTIRENITYGDESPLESDIIAAAKAAHAHEFILELPLGYDALVGERGIKLSGGQKQRIAIARAVYKKAPIMVFDEATSALDSESEEIVKNSLPAILGTHTAIIVAHRLSTISMLDRIIVIEDGKIIEEGNHNELLAKQGKYHSLWEKQSKQKEA